MNLSRRTFIVGAAGAVGTTALASNKSYEDAVKKAKKGALGKVVGSLPPGRYDAHIHVYPGEPNPEALVKSFEKAGLAGGCIFSECPNVFGDNAKKHSPEKSIDNVIKWASLSPTIYPFYWINPAAPDACDIVDMAVEKGIYGFKVIRADGRPVDDKSLPVYNRMAYHNKPITFHSGILWDGRPSSDNFRPANWEGLLDVPKLRFALAHISWPWCDECIAVFGKLLNAILARGEKVPEMFIDTTPGTPKIYRKGALTKVFTVGYDIRDHVMFGSDCRTDRYNVSWTTDWLKFDDAVYAELGLDNGWLDSIYRKSVERYLFGSADTKRSIPTPDGIV